MSKIANSSNVNTKVIKRETSKLTRTESTTKQTTTKSTTSKTSTVKKPTTRPAEEKDSTRPSKTTATTVTKSKNVSTKVLSQKETGRIANSKIPGAKSISPSSLQKQVSSVSSTVRGGQVAKKSSEPKQNATQATRIKRIPSKESSASSPTPRQPLRAKHTAEIKEAIKKNTSSKATKANAVLDTHSNVTVASPPPKRKSQAAQEVLEEEPSWRIADPKLTRKGSRVLAPEEIVVLKRESAKRRSEEQIRRESERQTEDEPALAAAVPFKDPVAFEVTFDNPPKPDNERLKPPSKQGSSEIRERSRSRVRTEKETNNEDETNYSDDFDSYESDFEASSSQKSSQHTEGTSDESEERSQQTNEEEEESSEDEEESGNDTSSDPAEDPEHSQQSKHLDDTDDESEITQDPITVLHRDKERKLDSGHYDMNSRKNPKLGETSAQSTQHLVDSFETFSLNASDQLDSGISAYGPSTLNLNNSSNKGNFQVYYFGYRDFVAKPIINKRGKDLMAKIQLDTLAFTLFDMKPISYDVFMQTYGKLNTTQCSTQTQDNLMHVEQQTDMWETRSMWTQHPAQYDWNMVQMLNKQAGNYGRGALMQNCCGEYEESGDVKNSPPECSLELSLQTLKDLGSQRSSRNLQNHVRIHRKPINYERLNTFLLKSSMVIDQLLGASENKAQSSVNPSELGSLERITEFGYELQTSFLNTLKVVKIFSNPKHNLVITVHESLPETNVYQMDFSQLLMVWCISVSDKPTRLLTTWSYVSRVEISHDSSDIVVAALRDGSVALWDLRETYSFCSKLDGYLTHFAATQSIVPSCVGLREKQEILMDLGSCLDIKSFRTPSNSWGVTNSAGSYGKSQFVSLHDSGMLTVWTLVETTEASFNPLPSHKTDKSKKSNKLSQKFGYSSPWARVKLIQSSIVYLRDFLETKTLQSLSRFDKTKALFQKNIYSDEALKELHENNGDFGQQGLRFTSIECGSENIYICTNRNFILMCSKTLKAERFRRIVLNESRLLFPTALKVLSNENFLAVGLSNGAVMIINCALNKQLKRPQSSSEKCPGPGTPHPGHNNNDAVPADIDSITGKSCAIQNIVLNSQKSYDSMDFSASTHDMDMRPNTAAFVALIDTNRKPFELRVYDQQVILSGSVLRKNLIQSLELSSDGWRLFAVSNGRIRVYDFYLDQEIQNGEDIEESDVGKVLDIGCGKSNQNEMNLMVLKVDSKVEVYVLKK
uniref:WD repeat-containing protein 60 n=1 Tax=Stomoxys calcitrans TaxID=35570 RepID=A0A1I8QBF1_STOCA